MQWRRGQIVGLSVGGVPGGDSGTQACPRGTPWRETVTATPHSVPLRHIHTGRAWHGRTDSGGGAAGWQGGLGRESQTQALPGERLMSPRSRRRLAAGGSRGGDLESTLWEEDTAAAHLWGCFRKRDPGSWAWRGREKSDSGGQWALSPGVHCRGTKPQ